MQICLILRFSWSILVKGCVHLRRRSSKTQMLLLEKNIFHKYWLFCYRFIAFTFDFFILLPFVCHTQYVSMELLSLSRRSSSSRNVPSGEEWEEAAVFAGYFFSFFRQCRAWSQASAVGIFGAGRRPTRFALTVARQKPAITKEKVSGTLVTVNWIAFSIFIALFLIELSYSECLSYRESSKHQK